jgi:metal-responsive CopG/Arc/MetJ family transcriptional regulator
MIYKEAEVRILVDIPNQDLIRLNLAARDLGLSRAELIRRAITASLEPYRAKMNHEAFGIWAASHTAGRAGKKTGRTEDGLEYQRRMREEW